MARIAEDELTLGHVRNLTPRKAANLLRRVELKLSVLSVPKKKKRERHLATVALPILMLENDAETLFYMKLLMARNDLKARLESGHKE